MASGIGVRFTRDCTGKSGKLETGRRLFEPRPAARNRPADPAARGDGRPPNPAAGKKFLDSWPVLFYYFKRISLARR